MAALRTPFALDHAPPSDDLPVVTRLGVNASYFDAMLSLIPAKYYLRDDDEEDEEAGDVQYHRNKAGNAPRQHIKESTKKSRKQRYAADATMSIPERQQAMAALAKSSSDGPASGPQGSKRKRAADDGASDAFDSDTGDAAAFFPSAAVLPRPGAPAQSLDELRARLAARISMLKKSRESTKGPFPEGTAAAPKAAAGGAAAAAAGTSKKPAGGAAAALPLSKKQLKKQLQRQRGAAGKESGKAGVATDAAPGGTAANSQPGNKPKPQPSSAQKKQQPGGGRPAAAAAAAAAAQVDAEALDFAFGALASDAAAAPTAPASGAPVGKRGKLQHLLKRAQVAQHRLERLAAEGKPEAKLEASFASALKRAEGEKTFDDPALLAKSLKRLQKSKAKSAAAWAGRKEQEVAGTAAREETRNENLRKKKNRGAGKKEVKGAPGAGGSSGAAAASGAAKPLGAGRHGPHSGHDRQTGEGGSSGGPKGGAGGVAKPHRAGFEGKKAFLNA